MSSIAMAADVSHAAAKAAKAVAGLKRKREERSKEEVRRLKVAKYGITLLKEVKRAEEQLLKDKKDDFVHDLVILGGLHKCPRCGKYVSDLTRCPAGGNHWD